MQTFLDYGDGESAVKISFQNERIISLLEIPKIKKEQTTPSIQKVASECIILQEDCDTKLRMIASELKKELNTSMVKRQIKLHLQKNT